MDTEKIKQIIALFEESNVASMDLELDDMKIKLDKGSKAVVSLPTSNEYTQVATPSVETKVEAPVETKPQVTINSPIVGTFYAAASQGSEPYVKVGDSVKEGDVVCIIEAMKVMNEIKADKSGVISEILVSDGAMVQFDEPLMVIGE